MKESTPDFRRAVGQRSDEPSGGPGRSVNTSDRAEGPFPRSCLDPFQNTTSARRCRASLLICSRARPLI
jgi:hypothetical protein